MSHLQLPARSRPASRSGRLSIDPLEPRRLLAVSGAIFTTDATGSVVNGNIYADKLDVYLNGGPRKPGAAGLTPGDYYVQVTNPSGGVVLGTTVTLGGAAARPFHVNSQGELDTDNDPTTHDNLQLASILDSDANGSIDGYLDTPNNGGEYKVWISLSPTFANSESKTDNFKVRSAATPDYALTGFKFHDHNGNGIQDPGDEGLAGWVIGLDENNDGTIDETTLTGSNGQYGFLVDAGVYSVREDVAATISYAGSPYAGQSWVQTTANPAAVTIPDDADPLTHVALGGDFGNFQTIAISGHKFYDANANGLDDDGKAVKGIKVTLDLNADGTVDATTYTDVNGNYSFSNVGPGKYLVKEVVPNGQGTWVQTFGNAGYTIQVGNPANNPALTTGVTSNFGSTPIGTYIESGGTDAKNDFGNVALGADRGHTLGFWSNKNGQALIDAYTGYESNALDGGLTKTAGVMKILSNLNLKSANGTDFDPTTYAQFRTWILGATATNMAYMLSAQMAAMRLNVLLYGQSASALVYAPALAALSVPAPYNAATLKSGLNALGFISVGNLITLANNALALAGGNNTTASGFLRSYEGVLKDVLDSGNNNLNFALGSPPPVFYL